MECSAQNSSFLWSPIFSQNKEHEEHETTKPEFLLSYRFVPCPEGRAALAVRYGNTCLAQARNWLGMAAVPRNTLPSADRNPAHALSGQPCRAAPRLLAGGRAHPAVVPLHPSATGTPPLLGHLPRESGVCPFAGGRWVWGRESLQVAKIPFDDKRGAGRVPGGRFQDGGK